MNLTLKEINLKPLARLNLKFEKELAKAGKP